MSKIPVEQIGPIDIFTQAKRVLQRPNGEVPHSWTRFKLARNKDGVGSLPDEEEAASFCALGAVHRAAFELGVQTVARHYGSPGTQAWCDAERILCNVAPAGSSVAELNDRATTTLGDILGLFDAAIREAIAVAEKEKADAAV